MTDKIKQAWLYETGLIETLCFYLADEKIYWYKTLFHKYGNRFVYSTCADTGGLAIVKCAGPI